MNISEGVNLLDAETALRIEDGKAIFRRTQEITSGFLDNLADEREASRHTQTGDLHKVASIPTAIVEKWMAEGFNIFDRNNTLADILKRLQSEDMQRLMATEKRII